MNRANLKRKHYRPFNPIRNSEKLPEQLNFRMLKEKLNREVLLAKQFVSREGGIMQVYYAFKNRRKVHKQDADYHIYPPKTDEQTERRAVGKLFYNRSRNRTQYFKILIYDHWQENNSENKSKP